MIECQYKNGIHCREKEICCFVCIHVKECVRKWREGKWENITCLISGKKGWCSAVLDYFENKKDKKEQVIFT